MRSDVQEGMRVFTADGVRLGTVVGCGEDTFVVERGLLKTRDYRARYGDVVTVRDGEVHLGLTKDEVSRGPGARAEAGGRTESVLSGSFGQTQDIVIPLAHEEAVPRTLVHEVGQLRVHKVVRTEVKHFSIPVRREELVVERVPAGGTEDSARARAADSRPGPAGFGPFEEATLVIPLLEERVEFTKTAHVWQEVAVAKSTVEELRQVHTTVRRETAEVEERGEVLHEGPVDGLHS
ncbi:YsnF/AvaK domain-containing protein [Pyxidicoccus xibeiensis]|uniref:YsnF/AvaK domain-containing protein n=1 Tax=Pyxidicoccus xibeiensis TaxID=2906759 RepID=UPI0020A7E2F1|nr:YsnF/AvaK domain-containing protein [Pyxidicoccus xibeiensis]MCP3139519.1 YsnF/AvaK domain-containing protein [Pyxidicoccus xibeiensis]